MAEKVVRAPFTGRLGLRLVDIGQYLSPGTAIVTLQQLDPMFVDFYLPQQALEKIAVGQTVEVTADAYPDRAFAGTVSSLNARVDPCQPDDAGARHHPECGRRAAARDVSDRFGHVRGTTQSLVTIPNMAVAYNPYGSLVYVVRPEKDKQGKDSPRRTPAIHHHRRRARRSGQRR